MHSSGIFVSEDLRREFQALQNEGAKLRIVDEAFTITDRFPLTGELEDDFRAAAEKLAENEASFIMLRDVKAADAKWILVFCVPDSAPVRDKMIYASSRAALIRGLAVDMDSELDIGSKADCTLDNFQRSTQKVYDIESMQNMMTFDERTKFQAVQESSMERSTAVKVAAIADIPIQVADPAKSAMEGFASDQIQAVILNLDQESEVMQSMVAEKSLSVADVAGKLPADEPRYVLYRYSHTSPEDEKKRESKLFVYYCPDAAKPRQKMFFSSSKSMAIKLFTELKVDVEKNLEISDPAEFADESFKHVLYPPKENKRTFGKPKRVGRGKARVNAKFSAS